MIPAPVQFTNIASGDLGVFQTLAVMRALARAAATDPDVRGAAVAWTAGARSPVEAARMLRAALARVYRYVDDPAVETLYAPAWLLHELAATGAVTGDCDDLSTLAAALGLAVGLPMAFVVVAEEVDGVAAPVPFSHVYAVAVVGGGGGVSQAACPAGLTEAGGGVEYDLTRPSGLVIPIARSASVWV